MTRVVVPIRDISNTVSKFVAKSVIEQLAYKTGIDFKDVIYNERGGVSRTRNRDKSDNALQLKYDNYIMVNFTEDFSDSASDAGYRTSEYVPIFSHPAIGVGIRPSHSMVKMELEIIYRSDNYGDLVTFINKLRRETTVSNNVDYHDIAYDYKIPDDIIAYINEVHIAMNESGLVNRSVIEFNGLFFTDGVMVKESMNGVNKDVVVRVINTGCLGMYSDVPTKIETSKDEPVSEVSFTYTLEYEQINALVVDYQRFIYNKLVYTDSLKQYYMGRNNTYSALPDISNRTKLGDLIYGLEAKSRVQGTIKDTHYYDEDRWSPSHPRPNTAPLFVIPFQVDSLNPKDIFTLDDIVGTQVTTALVTLLKANAVLATQPYQFPVTIDLYQVNASELEVAMTLDGATGIMTSLNNMVLSDRYYVVISISTNMVRSNIKVLQRSPQDLLMILQLLDPLITMRPRVPSDGLPTNTNTAHEVTGSTELLTIGNGTFVTDDSIVSVLTHLGGTTDRLRSHFRNLPPLTVSNFVVTAAKRV